MVRQWGRGGRQQQDDHSVRGLTAQIAFFTTFQPSSTGVCGLRCWGAQARCWSHAGRLWTPTAMPPSHPSSTVMSYERAERCWCAQARCWSRAGRLWTPTAIPRSPRPPRMAAPTSCTRCAPPWRCACSELCKKKHKWGLCPLLLLCLLRFEEGGPERTSGSAEDCCSAKQSWRVRAWRHAVFDGGSPTAPVLSNTIFKIRCEHQALQV